jgi:hypothetical protein
MPVSGYGEMFAWQQAGTAATLIGAEYDDDARVSLARSNDMPLATVEHGDPPAGKNVASS